MGTLVYLHLYGAADWLQFYALLLVFDLEVPDVFASILRVEDLIFIYICCCLSIGLPW